MERDFRRGPPLPRERKVFMTRISIRWVILAIAVGALGGCAVEAPPDDGVAATAAAATTYECLDPCIPGDPNSPRPAPTCFHICVLNREGPVIGGSSSPSRCAQIHQLQCGDGCCDSQEAAYFKDGRLVQPCPSDCTTTRIDVRLDDDGIVRIHDGTTRSLASIVGEFLVPDNSCR
jgi:hypothetical protein